MLPQVPKLGSLTAPKNLWKQVCLAINDMTAILMIHGRRDISNLSSEGLLCVFQIICFFLSHGRNSISYGSRAIVYLEKNTCIKMFKNSI